MRCLTSLSQNIYILPLLKLETVSIILYIQSLTGQDQEPPGLDIEYMFPIHTVQSTLYNPHRTMRTVLYTLYNPYCTIHTV